MTPLASAVRLGVGGFLLIVLLGAASRLPKWASLAAGAVGGVWLGFATYRKRKE